MLQSLPAWGAWVEINIIAQDQPTVLSLPAWGAWVEISSFAVWFSPSVSLPAWGAWVEMRYGRLLRHPTRCRSPHGERGLKSMLWQFLRIAVRSLPAWGAWVEIDVVAVFANSGKVAPRMGSVG